jgi:hypothetical protein
MRRDVEGEEHGEPDRVDEMPVDRAERRRRIAARAEITERLPQEQRTMSAMGGPITAAAATSHHACTSMPTNIAVSDSASSSGVMESSGIFRMRSGCASNPLVAVPRVRPSCFQPATTLLLSRPDDTRQAGHRLPLCFGSCYRLRRLLS